MKLVSLLSFLSCLAVAKAFFSMGGKAVSNKNKIDPAVVDEAVELYQRKYPKRSGERQRSWFAGAGMPSRDFDGTQYAVAKSSAMGKSFADRDTAELQATFREMAQVYGSTQALDMVQNMPIVMAANRNNFAPSLAILGETFGPEDAKAMVQRNPGLLFLKPTGAGGADTADNLTMQFSYIVAFTRPLGPVLLYGLLFLLCSPAIEAATGLPLKETFTFGLL